jgi:hypothetical protein
VVRQVRDCSRTCQETCPPGARQILRIFNVERRELRLQIRVQKAPPFVGVVYWAYRTASVSTQWGSNRVSGACLPKTGIFAVVAGDFCRNGLRVRHFRSSETGAELQKRANGGLFRTLRGGTSGLRNAWLGREDSNLRMGESKSGRTFNEINEHSELIEEFDPKCINRLGGHSEWIICSTQRA